MTLHTPQGAASSRRAEYLALALTLLGLGVSLWVGWISDGYYMDDDLTHLRFARAGWGDGKALLYRWARPGKNIPMALAAHIGGMAACRILSALMTAGAAYLSWRIARRIFGATPWAALAPLLLWAQPLVFKLSLTTLTETPGLLYLTAGIWLYLRGNRVWGCAVVSLLFITRDETMALAPLMAVAVLYDAWREQGGDLRKVLSTGWVWACALACIWAVAAYGLAAWAVGLTGDGSPLNIFNSSYTAEYGRGTWLHYLGIWPEAAGLGVLVLAVGGAVWLRGRAWLVSAWVLGLVALNTVIFARGMFASGGYSRFLVPVGGLVAVLGAGGLQALLSAHKRYLGAMTMVAAAGWIALGAWVLWAQYSKDIWPIMKLPFVACLLGAGIVAVVRRPRWQRAALVLVVVAAAGMQIPMLYFHARPLRLRDVPIYDALIEARDRVAEAGYGQNPAYSQHVVIEEHRPDTEHGYSNPISLDLWRKADPGTLYFWDSKYANKPPEADSTPPLLQELQRLGTLIVRVRREATIENAAAEVRVYIRDATPADAPPELPADVSTGP